MLQAWLIGSNRCCGEFEACWFSESMPLHGHALDSTRSQSGKGLLTRRRGRGRDGDGIANTDGFDCFYQCHEGVSRHPTLLRAEVPLYNGVV